ncbi:hypothetical protein Pst134EB_016826 [Puccinia striiformis f. sp. tritici]|uniref:RRM domain-containing protein n=1 Tax=Puccinia striiformis f. sp. tritici PST-78 TaxID=1165861 RepID=A0A0L0VFL4_9BASI|nr:hypothetical protein Pst134EB_016826 [Puccinia striiformis f. sp. tritici]KNE98082.1 hypothetical protein PSTG_08756 [Puccinia striiformis f. sp. tritici PST-78]
MSVDAGGKVSVGGLDKTTDSGSLQSTFGQFGEVTEAVVMQDHNTGESRGFGFVTFKQEADAHSAVQALDGQQLDGRKILVNFDRTQNGGGGGGGQRHGKNAFYDGYAYGEDGTAGKQK